MPVTKIRIAGLVCLGLGAVLMVFAIYAEYTTALFETVTVEQVSARPQNTSLSFSVGSLYWEMNDYANDSRLEPLRTYFHAHCSGEAGRDAAECLSNAMSVQSPFGAAATELFQARYDPIDALARHSKGEPGDCVTRSGLIAAILLSVRIPARLVQLVPKHSPGHNVVSVWEEGLSRWEIVDPTMALRFYSELSPWQSPGFIRAEKFGPIPRGAEQLSPNYDILFSRYITYPEPWLYMRVGPKQSHWPFRGAFAELKRDSDWSLGTTQQVLRWSVAMLTLSALVVWWRRP